MVETFIVAQNVVVNGDGTGQDQREMNKSLSGAFYSDICGGAQKRYAEFITMESDLFDYGVDGISFQGRTEVDTYYCYCETFIWCYK